MWVISNVNRCFRQWSDCEWSWKTTLESESLLLRDGRGFPVDNDEIEADPLLEAV